LIEKPKNFHKIVINFIREFELKNIINLNTEETPNNENMIQNQKIFKKIYMNRKFYYKYIIYFSIFLAILLIMFLMISEKIHSLKNYFELKDNILKVNFILLKSFSKIFFKIDGDPMNSESLHKILERISNIYQDKDYIEKNSICNDSNYFDGEECNNLFGGIVNKNFLESTLFIMNNLYQTDLNINTEDFKVKEINKNFQLFLFFQKYQEMLFENKMTEFKTNFYNFTFWLISLMIIFISFGVFWFFFEFLYYIKSIKQRILKPVDLLKFISQKKFYSDSKLKLFINKINLF
jgi:hypothetical protein